MFWKKHTEPVPVAVTPADIEPQAPTPATAEEKARQWFLEKTGQPMPEEFKAWLRQLSHDEAVRVTTQTAVLGRGELTKLHERKRLAQTKLENVEQNIETLRRKRNWTTLYSELCIRLDESRAALYEAGKQTAALRDVKQEIERYETFEPIENLYRQYQTLNALLQEARTTAAILQRKHDEAEAAVTQAQNAAGQADKQYQDATAQLHQSIDALTQAFKLDGTRDTLSWIDDIAGQWHKKSAAKLDTLRRRHTVLSAEAHETEQALAALRSRLQAMEPHAAMLENGGAIMVKLDRLHEIDVKREDLRHRATQTAAKRRDLDDRLSRLFEQDQSLVASLHSLQAEVQMHRSSNHGQDGTRLQAHAMELRGRRQRLQSAVQLWNRICHLYHDIDECRQAGTRQNIHLEQEAKTIEKLTNELRSLRQAAQERRYTYTISKSQNVIKLRADLREGTACSVCGAVNHPYHSDTMTEQNSMMSAWKTEAEMLDSEVRSKEQQLEELKLRHATEQGTQAAEQDFVRRLQEEFRTLTREWAQYAALGNGLNDCDPATQAESRQNMLRGLVENTDKQATEAQQELDTYNYHQLAINRAAEQIDKIENQRADLAAALNETNTGCQVMAGGVERIQKRIDRLTNDYTSLQNDLAAIITLPDWGTRWRASHENFKLELRERMEERDTLLRQAAARQERLTALQARLEELDTQIASSESQLLAIGSQQEVNATRTKETGNAYARLLGDEHATEAYSRQRRAVEQTRQEAEACHERLAEAIKQRDYLAGQTHEATMQGSALETKVRQLHSDLDEWIHTYNNSHPPVQYAELERVFKTGCDWHGKRQQVGEAQRQYTLAQAKEEDLRSALLALQADDNRAMDSKGETLEALISQQHTLEGRRNDIMHEIASIDLRLEAHQKALQRLEALN